MIRALEASLVFDSTSLHGAPRDFLDDRGVFSSNEVTLGGLLDGHWPPLLPSHGNLGFTPHSTDREKRLQMGFISADAYVMKTP